MGPLKYKGDAQLFPYISHRQTFNWLAPWKQPYQDEDSLLILMIEINSTASGVRIIFDSPSDV